MNTLQAILLGIVEGITEFLPISSTAHLMFVSEILGIAQSEFVKTFEIAIQLGAILAVVVLYWRSFLNFKELSTIFVAFLPTALIGFTLYPFIKDSLVGNIPVALAVLALGGIALIIFERWYGTRSMSGHKTLTYTQAALVGIAQAVAVIPGVSRSAATIVGGLMLGINRTTIVEFSFLLAVPTMAAATGYDVYKNYQYFSSNDFATLAIGFIVSFIVALIAIRWLVRYVSRNDFTSFGIYRIAAAALFFLLLWH